MQGFLLVSLSGLWLGILTSISPCPLASNIAALSFISKDCCSAKKVWLSGIGYGVGRALSYLVVGGLVIAAVLSMPELSRALQKYLNKALGPLFILVGMALLGLIRIPSFRLVAAPEERRYSGFWSSLFLGSFLALAFCPSSAALFFGGLIPLAMKEESSLWLPAIYGIGTAIPVLIFAVLIAAGVRSIGKIFKRLEIIELWARRLTGVTLIVIGVYFSLIYLLKAL